MSQVKLSRSQAVDGGPYLMASKKELAKLDPMIFVSQALLCLAGVLRRRHRPDAPLRGDEALLHHTLDLLREAVLIQDAIDSLKAKRHLKSK